MFKEKKMKYSSIAQLAERMTVNHDVAGSSPAGGASVGTSISCSDFSYKKSCKSKVFCVTMIT